MPLYNVTVVRKYRLRVNAASPNRARDIATGDDAPADLADSVEESVKVEKVLDRGK